MAEWQPHWNFLHTTVDQEPAALFAESINQSFEGTNLPAFWHHLYFRAPVSGAQTGHDGHQKTGIFIPPVDFPVRMWASSRLEYEGCFQIGNRIERRSRSEAPVFKTGRSGSLAFVRVLHEISSETGLLKEYHDIVYKERKPYREPETTQDREALLKRLEKNALVFPTDPVLLFRYSALTYNGHRIHYDLDFAREVEGYPHLVVHGPLLATLMLEPLRQKWPHAKVRSFQFKAQRPVFCLSRVFVTFEQVSATDFILHCFSLGNDASVQPYNAMTGSVSFQEAV